MWFVSDVVQIFSLVLQVVLLSFLLLQSYYRKYPLLFGYRLTYLATSILEVALVHHFGTKTNPTYTIVYWTDEVALDLLQFLLVIALTYRAMEGNPSRPAFGKFFAGIAVVMVLVSAPDFSSAAVFEPLVLSDQPAAEFRRGRDESSAVDPRCSGQSSGMRNCWWSAWAWGWR